MEANVFTSTNYHIECPNCRSYLLTTTSLKAVDGFKATCSCGSEYRITLDSSGIDSKKTDCVDLEKL